MVKVERNKAGATRKAIGNQEKKNASAW